MLTLQVGELAGIAVGATVMLNILVAGSVLCSILLFHFLFLLPCFKVMIKLLDVVSTHETALF